MLSSIIAICNEEIRFITTLLLQLLSCVLLQHINRKSYNEEVMLNYHINAGIGALKILCM